MLRIWLSFLLLVAAHNAERATGTLDWPSPYGGAMYGERVPPLLGFLALVALVWSGPARSAGLERASFAALAAFLSALAASPEPARYAFPAVRAVAEVMLLWQLVEWALAQDGARLRRMAAVVAAFQGLCLCLFAYAQTRMEIVPADEGAAGALFHLHGPWADMWPTAVGAAALLVVTVRR